MTKMPSDTRTDLISKEASTKEFASSSNVFIFERKQNRSHNTSLTNDNSVSQALDSKLKLLDEEFMNLSVLINHLKNITTAKVNE